MVFRLFRLGVLAAAALAILGCGAVSSSSNASAGNGSNQAPAATADFSLSAPAEVVVTPSSLQTISISVVPANGFSSAVSVVLSGLPAGVTATPSTFNVTPGATAQTVAIQANAGVAPGPINLVVTGTSGSLSQLMTTSTSQADFALSGPSQPIALTAGGTAQVGVSASAFNGFSGQVAATLTGLPAGVTASPSTLSFAPGGAGTITLTADASAQPGSSTLMLTGTSGALSNNLELPLALSAAPAGPLVPDFSLSLTPSAITLAAAGSPGQVTLSATAINGFTGPIGVSLSGLPSGVVAMPASFLLMPGTPQQISLSAASTSVGGTTSVTIEASSGAIVHSAQLTLTVQPVAPGFSFSLSPASVNLTIGGATEQVSVSANAVGAFTSSVSVTLSGLPSGVTATPSSFTLTPGGPAQTISLQAGSSATASQASVTVQGTSGNLSNNATLFFTVAAETPDFQLFAGPSSLNLSTTYIQSLTVALIPLNGFNNAATLTVSGLPSGVTIVNTPLPLFGDIAQYLELSDSNAAAGQSTITITATSGAITHSAQVNLNVFSSTSDFLPEITSTALSGNLGPGLLLLPGNFSFAILAAGASSGAPVSVQLSGLAPGLSLNQDQFTFTQTAGEDFTITTTSSAIGERGVLQAVFTGDGTTHEVDLPFHVFAQPSIVSYIPPLSIPQGYAANLFYETASTSQNAVQLWLGPNWPQNFWLTPQGSASNVSTSANQALGATNLPFEFDVDAISQEVSVPTQVVPFGDFSVSASPSTIGLSAGASQTFSVTASAMNGFTAPINLSVERLPAGLTAAPQTFSLNPGSSQTVTITAGSGYSSGGALSINAVSGGLNHYTQVAVSPGTYTGDLVATGNDFTAFGYVNLYTSGTYSSVYTGLGDPNVQVGMGYVKDEEAMSPPYVTNCGGSTTNFCTPVPIALAQWDLSSPEPLDRNKNGTVVLQANFGGGEQYAILPFSETLPDYSLYFTPTSLTIPAGGSASLSYGFTTSPANLPSPGTPDVLLFCGGAYYLNAAELQGSGGIGQFSFHGTPEVPPALQPFVEILENVLPCSQTQLTISVLATAPPGNYVLTIPSQLMVAYQPYVGGQSDNNYAVIGAAHTYGVSLTITAPTN